MPQELALPLPRGLPRAPEVAAPPTRMLDTTLSEGQASRDLSAIQREQAAVRGGSGPQAQRTAQGFMDQQAGELAATRERIARGFDPFGARVAETPQEAARRPARPGDVVSRRERQGMLF
jgi:hypothetical protein